MRSNVNICKVEYFCNRHLCQSCFSNRDEQTQEPKRLSCYRANKETKRSVTVFLRSTVIYICEPKRRHTAETRQCVANKPGFEPDTWGTVPETPASATPSVATSRPLLVDGRDATLNAPVEDLFQALRLGSVGQHFASEPLRHIKTSAHTTAFNHQVQHFAFYFAPIRSTSSG